MAGDLLSGGEMAPLLQHEHLFVLLNKGHQYCKCGMRSLRQISDSDCRFRGLKSVTIFLSLGQLAGSRDIVLVLTTPLGLCPLLLNQLPPPSEGPVLSIPISPSGKRQRKGKNCLSRRVAPRGWGTTFLSNARHWAHACSCIVSNCTLFLYFPTSIRV
jgi:hypothetical protein